MSNVSYHFGEVRGSVQTGSGVMCNPGRDQHITHVAPVGSPAQLAPEVKQLFQTLKELHLTLAQREAAKRELKAMVSALQQDRPDQQAAKTHLARFVQGLTAAGALTSASTAFAESIRQAGDWLSNQMF